MMMTIALPSCVCVCTSRIIRLSIYYVINQVYFDVCPETVTYLPYRGVEFGSSAQLLPSLDKKNLPKSILVSLDIKSFCRGNGLFQELVFQSEFGDGPLQKSKNISYTKFYIDLMLYMQACIVWMAVHSVFPIPIALKKL
jgi:hypothetical protein